MDAIPTTVWTKARWNEIKSDKKPKGFEGSGLGSALDKYHKAIAGKVGPGAIPALLNATAELEHALVDYVSVAKKNQDHMEWANMVYKRVGDQVEAYKSMCQEISALHADYPRRVAAAKKQVEEFYNGFVWYNEWLTPEEQKAEPYYSMKESRHHDLWDFFLHVLKQLITVCAQAKHFTDGVPDGGAAINHVLYGWTGGAAVTKDGFKKIRDAIYALPDHP
jgi:hypothetical protein